MKKITLLILTIFLSFSGYSQTEGFESPNVPNLVTDQWDLGPGGLGDGIWGVFDNGVGTLKSWSTSPLAHQGAKAAYMDRENIGAGNLALDYLATPAVTIPTNGQLRFWTRTTVLGDSNNTKYPVILIYYQTEMITR